MRAPRSATPTTSPPAPTSSRRPPTPGPSRWSSRSRSPRRRSSPFLRDDLTLFTYLHLAAYPDVAKALVAARTTALAYETVQLDDRRPAAAGPDERGRRAAGAAAGRPLPRAPQRRPRRADGRGARRAPGEGRRARRRQRRVERGLDRRRHGGRGRADRQEPRPPALGRPDPPRPDHDAGVEPWGDRAQRRRRRPRDRRRARRRRAGAGRRQRGDGQGDEAAGRHRRRRRRPGRLHRDDPRDHPRRPGVRAARRDPLRRRQHARRRAEHEHVRADQRHAAVHPGRRRARAGAWPRSATRRSPSASTPSPVG